jgi:opacity protein-like surface antigen
MIRNTKMLAAVSGVALALGAASAAGAQGFALGTGEWYGKVFGGATFPQSDSVDLRLEGAPNFDAGGDVDYDTGYVLGAAVGAYFTPNFATELEYAYRNSEWEGDEAGGGETSSNAVMLNAVYWMDGMGANGAVRPYFGGGLGWANIDLATDEFGDFERDSALAYQLFGGVAYDVTPNWSLMGELRWFGTGGDDTGSNDGFFFEDVQFSTLEVLVGAAYKF